MVFPPQPSDSLMLMSWPDGQLVVDLCRNLDLSGPSVFVEGLYWDDNPGKNASLGFAMPYRDIL